VILQNNFRRFRDPVGSLRAENVTKMAKTPSFVADHGCKHQVTPTGGDVGASGP
jgi:hypothetical protein